MKGLKQTMSSVLIILWSIMTIPGALAQSSGSGSSSGSSSSSDDNNNGGGGDLILVDVNSPGNVGIGTDTPQEKLHVEGNVKVTGTLELGDPTFFGDAFIATQAPTTSLSIGPGTAAGVTSTTLFINNVSNSVGVGTINPLANLDVRGSIFVRGGNGDADLNGAVNVLDALFVAQYVAGIVPITSLNQFANGDMNGDGILNMIDAEAIANLAVLPPGPISLITAQNRAKLAAANAYHYNFTTGNFGLGIQNPVTNLHVIGNILATGTITPPSDRRYKKEIKTLESSLDKVLQLRGVNYYMNTEEFPDYKFSEELQIGFIAQEVETILPELVVTHSDGYKSMDYMKVTPLLVEAVKEQQEIIEGLRKELEQVKATSTGSDPDGDPVIQKGSDPGEVDELTEEHRELIRQLEEMQSQITEMDEVLSKAGVKTIELQSDGTPGLVLNQNDPNPFTESTVISYVVPDHINDAQMIIHNIDGKVMQSIDLEPGVGKIRVYASDLSAGTYTYSIISDGQIVDTKKMIRAK